MKITPEILYSLLQSIEEGDPQDFGQLDLSDSAARELVCNHVCQFTANLAEQGVPSEHREALALALCARLVLENLVFHVERLQREGAATVDAAQVLAGLTRKR